VKVVVEKTTQVLNQVEAWEKTKWEWTTVMSYRRRGRSITSAFALPLPDLVIDTNRLSHAMRGPFGNGTIGIALLRSV
jgi:hypothetical protein